MSYTLDDIYQKLDELEKKVDQLKKFDYEAKNIKNMGNVVTDYQGNPLKVFYAKNAQTIDNKSYDDFINDMKKFFNPIIEDIKKMIKKQNEEKPLEANYIKDWTDLKIDQTKEFEIYSLDTLAFTPSYLEILVKLDGCSEKNGGTNGIITQIPPVGISIDGLPISKNNYQKIKNYSGWWAEDNQIKIYIRKADFPQWVGKCKKIKYKILAWR
jgi:hypothetical protein